MENLYIHQSRKNGFTLLELLVVVSIIGILASIAIPKFSDYRKRAFDTRALSDLRNVASAEEAYFMDHESYLSCSNNGCGQLPGVSRISKGVELNVEADDKKYVGKSSHQQGSGKIYIWDSEQGGLN